jgi:retron-type reverse transcriptase
LLPASACRPSRRHNAPDSDPGARDPGAEPRTARKKERFTALLHHVNIDTLWTAFYALKRKAAAGVDGVTWQDYEADLGRNLEDLNGRVHRGAYRPQPSRRTYIPKADGRQRPLAIAALEDKIVQGACVIVLNAIYEEDFLGFSYGFRPGRGPQDALDALAVAITSRKVNHILDADVRDFFGSVNHDWLIRFLEHRIGDKRIIRLIRKWLKAGILEDGIVTVADSGTGQGSVISPLLGNIYLHYVFDLWAERWRRQEARGDMIVVRYADDLVAGFEHEDDACGKSRRGAFQLQRKTRRDRMRAKLQEIKAELRQRMHQTIPDQGHWLRQVVTGHFAYYAVPTNSRALSAFRHYVADLWRRTLRRRSQKDGFTWDRMTKLANGWLPAPRIRHPWPDQRFAVKHPR